MKGSLPWDWARERLDQLTQLPHHHRASRRPPAHHGGVGYLAGERLLLQHRFHDAQSEEPRRQSELRGVCNENVEEAVIVEGQARQLAVREIPRRRSLCIRRSTDGSSIPRWGRCSRSRPRWSLPCRKSCFRRVRPAGCSIDPDSWTCACRDFLALPNATGPRNRSSGTDRDESHLVRVVQEELQSRVIFAVEVIVDVLGEVGRHLGFGNAQLWAPTPSPARRCSRVAIRDRAIAGRSRSGSFPSAGGAGHPVAPPRTQTQMAFPSAAANRGRGHRDGIASRAARSAGQSRQSAARHRGS